MFNVQCKIASYLVHASRTGAENLETSKKVPDSRLSSHGHILRIDATSLERKMLDFEKEGKSRRRW